MRSLDAAVFGEAMAMFIADEYVPLEEAEHYTMAVAGAEVNVAVGLTRLGYRVGWIGRLGADPLGRHIFKRLRRAGLDTGRVEFDELHPTGFQIKSRVREGDPQVVYFRKGSAASFMAPGEEDDAYIGGARHLHLTGIPPALSESCRRYAYHAIERARAAGASVSFDPNIRPSLWESEAEMRRVLNDLAARADWVVPGLGEGRALTGLVTPEEIAGFYLERGAGMVALKMGASGSALFASSGRYDSPIFPVEVVDTVGAGDGFAVGLIGGMLDGLPLGDVLTRANAVGALAVTARGDSDGLPTREQLNRFLRASGGPDAAVREPSADPAPEPA